MSKISTNLIFRAVPYWRLHNVAFILSTNIESSAKAQVLSHPLMNLLIIYSITAHLSSLDLVAISEI